MIKKSYKHLPLKQLAVFETLSRSQTFAQAAETLCMTQSGISQHIQYLENYLEVKLIKRYGKDGLLTEDGRYLSAILTKNLKGINDAVHFIKTRHNNLKIKSSRSFATKWLLPRLGHFTQKHPDINVFLGLFTKDEIGTEIIDFDVVIIYGNDVWPGYESVVLSEEYMAPVCRPALAPDSLKKLNNEVLLHPSEDHHDWKEWADYFQVKLDVTSGLTFETMYLALNAAIAGNGMAIGDLNLISSELKSNVLMAPFPMVYKTENKYYLLTHDGEENPMAKLFKDWIMNEFKQNEADILKWEAMGKSESSSR